MGYTGRSSTGPSERSERGWEWHTGIRYTGRSHEPREQLKAATEAWSGVEWSGVECPRETLTMEASVDRGSVGVSEGAAFPKAAGCDRGGGVSEGAAA